MTRLPTLDATRLVRLLKRAGFVEAGQIVWPARQESRDRPAHDCSSAWRRLKRNLMKLIINQAGLTDSQFLMYLRRHCRNDSK